MRARAVRLEKLERGAAFIALEVAAEAGVTYRIQFIGARRGTTRRASRSGARRTDRGARCRTAATVRSAGDDPADEHDLVVPLLHRDGEIAQARQRLFQLGEFLVVGAKSVRGPRSGPR